MPAPRNTELLNAALSYAARGLSVVPLCVPILHEERCSHSHLKWHEDKHNYGKVPLTKAGYKDATTDQGVIRLWWTKDFPGANIGIACRNILCIDADCHKEEENGLESLEYLQREHGHLPQTLQVLSGGGGSHYYFQKPKDINIRIAKIPGFPGLEVKWKASEGMCAPPSLHREGLAAYRWIDEHADIAPLPEWLQILIETPISRKGSGHEGVDQAIEHKNAKALYLYIPEIAALDDTTLALLKLDILKAFGGAFVMRDFDEVLKTEREKVARQTREKPIIQSLRDLMAKQFTPPKWVIPNILPEGLIILAGKSKMGKSWLMLQSGLGIAGGGIVLGSIKVEKGEVLYLALEDHEQRLQDRAKQLLPPNGAVPLGFDYATSWPKLDADGLQHLEDWIIAHPHARLIIIDPFVKVRPEVKQKQGMTGYDADYEVLRGLKYLSDTYHLCILVIFHLRKSNADDPFDEINATSGAPACADGTLILKRGRGEADATLLGTGRDFKNDVDLAISFNDGFWKALGSAAAYTISKERKAILDVLEKAGVPLQPKEIAVRLNKPSGSIRYLVMQMKDDKQIKETEKGYIPNGTNTPNALTVLTPPNSPSVSEGVEALGVITNITNGSKPPSEDNRDSTVSDVSTVRGAIVTTIDGEGYLSGNERGGKIGVIVNEVEQFYWRKMIFPIKTEKEG